MYYSSRLRLEYKKTRKKFCPQAMLLMQVIDAIRQHQSWSLKSGVRKEF